MPEKEKPNILIAEDEMVTARLLRSRLEHYGYKVIGPAATGKAAVEMALKGKPDMIIMDINLKGDMDGIEAAKIIRSQLPVQIVYVTAHSEEEILSRAKLTIPNGYIIKPFQDRDLKIAVEMALYAAKVDVERRNAEQKLRKSEKDFQDLIKNIPVGIYRNLAGPEGKFLIANPFLAQMFGYESVKELMNVPASSLYQYPSARSDFASKLSSRKRVIGEELQLKRKDGSFLWGGRHCSGHP